MAAFLVLIVLFLFACEASRMEIVEVFDNDAPKEAYMVSPDGEKEAYYSWYRNGIKAEEMTLKNGVPDGSYRKWSVTGFVSEKGAYKDSLREGKWTFFSKEKIPYMQGSYKNGLKQGKWILFDESGKVMGEQFYRNDSATGFWKKFYKDVLVEENSCHPTNETGYFRSYSDEGKPLIYQACREGKFNGVFLSYYPGGSLHKVGNFDDGLRSGSWAEYYANGKLRKIEHWIASMRNGEWVRYDESGRRIDRAEFVDGTGVFEDTSWQNNRIHGEVRKKLGDGSYFRIETYENGTKRITADYPEGATRPLVKGFWENGKKEGAWRSWYRSGILKDSLNFKDGELFGEQFHYDSTGRLYKKETVMGKNTVVEMIR
ncbi:MAG: toxin-antitoxin system YwqK family antitoxin [Fibromonadales bacterium]|nr:toxin-antitoxin system YwqK family antitoxin [Fibromonadales bacterium]